MSVLGRHKLAKIGNMDELTDMYAWATANQRCSTCSSPPATPCQWGRHGIVPNAPTHKARMTTAMSLSRRLPFQDRPWNLEGEDD